MHCDRHVCGGQRTVRRSRLFLSTLRLLGMQRRSSGLRAGFTRLSHATRPNGFVFIVALLLHIFVVNFLFFILSVLAFL